MSDLGFFLETFRAEAGLSRRQLAQASGLTEAYVTRIEENRLPFGPSADALISLACTLGIPARELLEADVRTISPFDPAINRVGVPGYSTELTPSAFNRLTSSSDGGR